MATRTVLVYLGRGARWAALALLLVLALVGLLFVTRGTAVQHVRGVGADGAPMAPAEPQFALGVALLTNAPLTPGNHVELALNGDGTFPRLWEDLRAATQSIAIQNYYGQPGRVADTLSRILFERAAAGVRVFLLYDAFGTQDIPAARLAAFRAAGIRAVPFRPLTLGTLWRAQNRSHVRAVVIDGRVGWTGGFGIDDKWLGDGHTNGAWRDTNVRFTGPAVLQLQAAFAAAWSEATGVLFTGRATVDRDSAAGGVTAGLLYATPTLGSTAAERFLALSIAGARRSLYVTNAYFAPDENFVGLLTQAARRGVDVRLLVGGQRTDIHMTWQAGRARYERLLAAGVRIYEWQPSTLHAKTFVVDGTWSSIGTMNFDNRSLALNDEVTLMILDPTIGRRLEAQFREDLRWATEITAARFAQRPWTERVGEWVANRLTRLL
ncbi:MAG TPA: phospholipase D-like domain-containing protein [Gemmatimonadaceae bacterium]|nr:phospholipase D-like domain-containing protein [Gemmatimonadaceae bacterium]